MLKFILNLFKDLLEVSQSFYQVEIVIVVLLSEVVRVDGLFDEYELVIFK